MNSAAENAEPDFTLAGIRRQLDDENSHRTTASAQRSAKASAISTEWLDARRFTQREYAISRMVRKDFARMESRFTRVADPLLDVAALIALIAGVLLLALAVMAGSWALGRDGGVAVGIFVVLAAIAQLWRARRRNAAYYERIKYQHGVGYQRRVNSDASVQDFLTLIGGWSGLTDRGFTDAEADRIIRDHGGLPAVREDEISPALIQTRRALDRMRKGEDR